MASHTMSSIDDVWTIIEENQKQLSLLLARLGLPPPPPLLPRPPPATSRHSVPTKTVLSLKPPPSPAPFAHRPALAASKKRVRRRPKSAPKTVPKSTSNNTHRHPKRTTKTTPKKASSTALSALKTSPQPAPVNMLENVKNSPSSSMPVTPFEGSSRRHEWRPPWRLVVTTPNAFGRVEWRPPWDFIPSLRTRTFLGREY